MKIIDIKATSLTVPIQAPIRHSYGVHTSFTRTLVEIETDEGITGLGETADSPERVLQYKSILLNESPFDLEKLHMKISQRFYFSREALISSAVEMALLDIQGKALNVPVYKLLGGKIREKVDMAAYLFFRYPTEDYDVIDDPDSLVSYSSGLVEQYGFQTLKLKGGVFNPMHEVDCMTAMRNRFGREMNLRFDPNALWTVETALRRGKDFEKIDLEYYEDPAWGLNGLARVRERIGIPIATNMAVLDFEQLGAATEMRSIDVVLSDPWYWGGMRQVKALSRICHTFGLGMGMHSGLEFGVGLAAMLHCASTIPNLTHAIDAHYHHLLDDIIEGGMIPYREGQMTAPEGPGLGIILDRDKVQKYAELSAQGIGENYYSSDNSNRKTGADPYRPSWYPKYPGW